MKRVGHLSQVVGDAVGAPGEMLQVGADTEVTARGAQQHGAGAAPRRADDGRVQVVDKLRGDRIAGVGSFKRNPGEPGVFDKADQRRLQSACSTADGKTSVAEKIVQSGNITLNAWFADFESGPRMRRAWNRPSAW